VFLIVTLTKAFSDCRYSA